MAASSATKSEPVVTVDLKFVSVLLTPMPIELVQPVDVRGVNPPDTGPAEPVDLVILYERFLI
jgi:hypothetical protein